MEGSRAETEGVEIKVRSAYLPDQTDGSQWLFVYEVLITNNGDQSVRLLTRHWIITNGWGETSEVRGEGVIGQQPMLLPGRSFRYTSYCPLDTESGSMRGSYGMEREDGTRFDAEIGAFFLCDPGAIQ